MQRKRRTADKKLSLADTCAMAIGGMVGGGIFAVLGEAVREAGNAAFLAFAVAGVLALITGLCYSRLTLDFDEPGGSFTYVDRLVGRATAGTLSWFLLLGYVFAMSLYAYTFGEYGARLVGLSHAEAPYVGIAIVAVLAAINLLGVRESGFAEDLLVYSKIAILLGVTAVGLIAVDGDEALPIFETGGLGIFSAAALIFVAYEGFELLNYDYDDIADHRRNLPRAMLISIPVVILIYVLVAFVTTGSVSDATVQAHKETVLAYVAQPVLGHIGFVAVLVAAVLSTASAINSTLFASARLARRIGAEQQLPRFVSRGRDGGVPAGFVLAAGAATCFVQFFGNLTQITTFSSLVFLLVYAVVNLTAVVHGSFDGWKRLLPIAGVAGCCAALAMLVWVTARQDPQTLGIIGGVAAGLAALRVLFVGLRRARPSRR